MDKPLITICTVNYNSSEFIGLMLSALQKLTGNPYRVIIRDNNSKESDYLNLVRLIKECNYNNVDLYRVTTSLSGSLAHGTALNELCRKIDTRYGVILDADATFLIKDWDKILISKVNDITPIYGTQADLLGGKPTDFPLMFAVFFVNNIFQKMDIDFRPGDLSKYQDTGWELREKYTASGFKGGLLYDFNTRGFKSGPFRDVVCNEYYLSKEAHGPIFASHFGRGSAPKAKNLIRINAGENVILKSINRILCYPNIVKWRLDKCRWLKICRKIVDDQSYAK